MPVVGEDRGVAGARSRIAKLVGPGREVRHNEREKTDDRTVAPRIDSLTQELARLGHSYARSATMRCELILELRTRVVNDLDQHEDRDHRRARSVSRRRSTRAIGSRATRSWYASCSQLPPRELQALEALQTKRCAREPGRPDTGRSRVQRIGGLRRRPARASAILRTCCSRRQQASKRSRRVYEPDGRTRASTRCGSASTELQPTALDRVQELTRRDEADGGRRIS